MLFEDDFYSILGPAIILVFIFIIGYMLLGGKKHDELEKIISSFKLIIFPTGFLMIVLLFLLPSTPVLSTSGFPNTINDVQSSEQLLEYLQEYNQALVQTTKVLHWFIFIFVWFFLASLYSFTKALSRLRKKKKNRLSFDAYRSTI